MIADWEAAPPGRLRKSASSDDVKALQIACRGFLVAVKEVQKIVGDAAWAAHEAEVTAKFFSKALDSQITKTLEGWPLKQGKAFVDISGIPSMTLVVTKTIRRWRTLRNKRPQSSLQRLSRPHTSKCARASSRMPRSSRISFQSSRRGRTNGATSL